MVANAFLCQAQTINIPDPNFKAKLLTGTSASFDATGTVRTNDVDTNNDGEIQLTEAQAVTGLYIYHNPNQPASAISLLTGIEHFTNLKTLSCHNNQISSLDLSIMPSLQMLSCFGNGLTELILPVSGTLKQLGANDNALTQLNLSGQNQLDYLDVSDNGISTLDLTSLPLLKMAYLQGNPLTAVDFSNNTQLEMLRLENTLVSHIDCSNTAVNMLWAHNNPNLQTINVQNGVLAMSDPDMLSFGIWVMNVPSLQSICIDNGEQSNLTLFNYNETGNVEVFTGENCSVAVPMGLEENGKASVKIYPNPAVSLINISGMSGAGSITIYNVLGQEVKTAAIIEASSSIDVSDLKSGTYHLTLKGESATTTHIIIKQ